MKSTDGDYGQAARTELTNAIPELNSPVLHRCENKSQGWLKSTLENNIAVIINS